MKPTRAAYVADEDYAWSDIKKARRRAYLNLAMWDFLEQERELKGFLDDEVIRRMTDRIMAAYEVIRAKIVKKVPHPGRKRDFKYFDHHKIIAGTQLAILTALPLRTVGTASIPGGDVLSDPHKYFDVICLNARLAIFIALDILKNWFGLSPAGFCNRKCLHVSCLAQLANYCCDGKGGAQKQRYFPLFWCSMLWYAIEEILRSE